MKKLFLLLLVIPTIFLIGCSKKDNLQYEVKDVETDFVDLKFIEERSEDIVVEYKNKLSEEIYTSIDGNFRIFRISNGNESEEINTNLAYEDIALIIQPDETLQQQIPISKLSPRLEKGEYEIRKKFNTENDEFEINFRLNIK